LAFHVAHTYLYLLQTVPSQFDNKVFKNILLFNGHYDISDANGIHFRDLGLLDIDVDSISLKFLESVPASSDESIRAERGQWLSNYKKAVSSPLTPSTWADLLKVGTVIKAISLSTD
jgi:hypothetical protein